MKICMILYDPQEFGGLEEYSATLAVSLTRQGHQVSVLSATWVPAENQYLQRLRKNGVKFVQLPRFLSLPASDWKTKIRILNILIWVSSPLTLLLASGLYLRRQCTWKQAKTSAIGWLRDQLLNHYIGPDRREPLGRLLLNWWRLRWRPDLLHIQGYTSTLLFAIEWAYAKDLPVIYEEHQTPDDRFDWWRDFQRSINKATTVVAVSETSAQALRDVCGVNRPIVVRSPLLPDPLDSGWHLNGRPHSSGGAINITTVARLSIAKGLRHLLEAAALVKATHPSVQFKVFGDGELRQELLDHASSLGLDGNAIFVGPFNSREELAHIMAQTDIFVMSSILEGQPLSVVEAMAFRRPIVTTSVGGIPELIIDGVNGLLCPPKDPDCLAIKIRFLLDNPEMRATLGQAARSTYENGPYQPSSVSNHFISIYNQARDICTRTELDNLAHEGH